MEVSTGVALRFIQLVLLLQLSGLVGCASYGVVENKALGEGHDVSSYSIESFQRLESKNDDLSLMLAFSGGGTRAAALAYGVLLELRDTAINDGAGAGSRSGTTSRESQH